MEHRGSGEQAIFRFDGANRAGYDIPTVEGDNRVTALAETNPVPWYSFGFYGTAEGSRACGFLARFGCISGEDHPLFINNLTSLRAVIGGTRVEYRDALIPTSTPVAAAADFDGNGAVDLADFFLFADHFGQPARAKLLVMAQELIGLPDDVQLHQNVPNPFNRQTLISFLMRAPGPAWSEGCQPNTATPARTSRPSAVAGCHQARSRSPSFTRCPSRIIRGQGSCFRSSPASFPTSSVDFQ